MTAQLGPHLRHHARFYLSALAGTAVGAVLPGFVPRLIGGGAVFFAAYLSGTAFVLSGLTPEALRRRAEYADEGIVVVALLTVAAIVLSLGAVFVVLAGDRPPPLQLAAILLTVPLGWATLHTVAALRYAHLYYAPEKPRDGGGRDRGGLAFPGDGEPTVWDFLYFSFVVGMTAQVSDVQVLSGDLRRLTLLHGVASFFFNTVILALAVNVAAGGGR